MNWNARDCSWNHNHGTVSWATLTTDQFWHANSAYSFDGNDMITLSSPGWAIGQDMTLTAWIYPTTISWGAQRIFISSNDRYWLGLSASWLTWYVYDSWYNTLSSSLLNTWIALNTWTHVAMTYTANSLKIYSNGVLRNTRSVTWPIITSTNMYIGNWSSLAQWFVGTISSPAMYNRALSDAEILSLATVWKWDHSLLNTGEYVTHFLNALWAETTGLVWLYNLVDSKDTSWGFNHGAASWAVTFAEDTYWNHAVFAGNRNYGAWPTWTPATIGIGNKMNYTQATDFSWSVTVAVTWLPPNNWAWIFWSWFDNSVYVTGTNWAMSISLRWTWTNLFIWIWSNYWLTRLWEVHTIGFTYIASTQKAYAYLDWVLQNAWGSTWPTTFLTNEWSIGDNAIWGWNGSSCNKKIYNACVFWRALTALEHLQIANTQQGKLSRIKGKTYVKHIDAHTALSVEMSQKRSILQSNSIITV